MSAEIPDWETRWLEALAEDAEFQLVSRWTGVSLRLVNNDLDRIYLIDRSNIVVDPGSPTAPTVTLTGSPEAWNSFLSAIPRPPNHHILAMQRRRTDFTIDGRHALLENLRVINRALELLRMVIADQNTDAA